MLRCVVSELPRGHPRGEVQADVRNDGLNVINCLHGLTNIQQEKRLTATVETLREAIKLGDVKKVVNLSKDLLYFLWQMEDQHDLFLFYQNDYVHFRQILCL